MVDRWEDDVEGEGRVGSVGSGPGRVDSEGQRARGEKRQR